MWDPSASNMNVMTGKFDFAFFVNLNLRGKGDVIEWCRNLNLIASEYECPVCKLPMMLVEKADDIDGFIWFCQGEEENKHLIRRSVRQGSFFQRSNLSIIQTLLLIYLWIKKATCDFIEDELILPKEVIEEWLNFCREVCVEICLSKSTKLGGEGVVVQIDECKFHKKELKRNDYIVGEWAYVGFEKETDKGFLEVVKERSEVELLNVIKKYVLPGTILVSDFWKFYDCLDDEEFVDLKETHGIRFGDIGVGIGSSVIGLRRGVKRTLNDVPHISRDFDVYVAEYMWRKLHSDIPYQLMRSFLEEVKILFPPAQRDSEVLT